VDFSWGGKWFRGPAGSRGRKKMLKEEEKNREEAMGEGREFQKGALFGFVEGRGGESV